MPNSLVAQRWIGNMVAISQLSQPNTWSYTEPKDPNPETEILMKKIHKTDSLFAYMIQILIQKR